MPIPPDDELAEPKTGGEGRQAPTAVDRPPATSDTSMGAPTAEELAAGGHDFSPLGDSADSWIAFTSGIDELSREIIVGEVTVNSRESVADYCRDWLKRIGPLITIAAGWPDQGREEILVALLQRWKKMCDHAYFDLDAADVETWMTRHKPASSGNFADVTDAIEAVRQCISVIPPREVKIRRRLAQTGAQKIVFKAEWRLGEERRSVVLKKVINGKIAAQREARAHPLLMQHPNIVRTYIVKNELQPADEFFLEVFMHVLDNDWNATGQHEAARLIGDIARALAFLNGQGLVHGDVKPDNIGIRDGRFVLLDFGVCRPWIEFLDGGHGTGSTRTRAPEVLEGKPNSDKSDVWSLGASAFRFMFGRFPLFEGREEQPPDALNASEEDKSRREEFKKDLLVRAQTRWEDLVTTEIDALKTRNLRFGELLEDMLAKDPRARPSAGDVLDRVLRQLGGLVGEGDGTLLPPLRELAQFRAYVAERPETLRTMPRPKRIAWKERVGQLEQELHSEEAEKEFVGALARYCAELLAAVPAPSADARDAIEKVQSELKRRQAESHPLYEDLLSAVKYRLKLAADEEPATFPPVRPLEDTLADALDHALGFAEVAEHPNFGAVTHALGRISSTSLP